jgi:hypothetical protein
MCRSLAGGEVEDGLPVGEYPDHARAPPPLVSLSYVAPGLALEQVVTPQVLSAPAHNLQVCQYR